MTKGTIISLVGAGGKTSTLYALAQSASRRGLQHLLTTTTMMIDPGLDPLARGIAIRYAGSPEAGILPDRNTLSLFGASERLEEVGKVKGLSPGQIDRIAPFWDLVIVEADGAKHRPVKAPAEHEPVIPEHSKMVIGCIGLDCLGKPLTPDTVHRPRHFGRVTGLQEGELISPKALGRLVSHRYGLFKSLPSGGIPVVLLNKADTIDPGTLKELFNELSSGRGRNRKNREYPGEERGEGASVAIVAVSMQTGDPEMQVRRSRNA